MTTWLVEDNGPAHAYPDDDTIEVAACGYALVGYCSHCGRDSVVNEAGTRAKRCAACVDKTKPVPKTDNRVTYGDDNDCA